MYYVYVLQDREHKHYIGYTADLIRRYGEHKKERPGFKLVYYEAYSNDKNARIRERKLKQFGSAWRGLRLRIEEV